MKKKAGRPKSVDGRVTLNITVPLYVANWLKATGNASACVRSFVDGEISERKGQGLSKSEVWNGTRPVRRPRYEEDR